MENARFTEQDLSRMRAYEQRTGEKIVYTFEEKCNLYRAHPRASLERAVTGITMAISGRLNLDNSDSFDGPDDTWKLKQLEENLEAIRAVLAQK